LDSTIKTLAELGLSTQTETIERPPDAHQLYIGLPRESSFQENRIALTPASVAILINNGHRVVVESNAGLGAHYQDQDYSEAGAEITLDKQKVFQAQIILKLAPLTEAELDLLHPVQILFSTLHLPTLTHEYLHRIMAKKITALAYEYLKDDSGSYPIVRATSEIAGSAAILIASEFLSNVNRGQGILLGGVSGVPPAKVVILGAGIVGENATRAALGLGAEIKVFDNDIYKLMRLQNHISHRVYTSVLNPDTLARELSDCDVAIGAIHSGRGRTPLIVTEEMVANMKKGAVILDVSIDQGGCFATSEITTHDKPTFVKYGVIHYCVPNIASRVAKSGSQVYSNILTPLLLKAHRQGGLEKLLWQSAGTRNGVYLYKGALTNNHLASRFQLKYTDLDLFLMGNM